MLNINDFLDYATNGAVNSTQTTKRAPSARVRPATYAMPTPAVKVPKMPAIALQSIVPQPAVISMPVVSAPSLEIVDYSDKAFAVFGDTKANQKQLEDLGGKFNRWLKKDGIATPGFIFSKKRMDAVRKAFSI